MSSKSIRTLSLFAGAGGLDLGFHRAGFRILRSVEIDPRFAASLEANRALLGSEALCQDVRVFHPDPKERIDFILGGPPCQSFSAAGRRAAGVSGTRDERGTLFEEYVRLLMLLRPRGFLFENVYGITGAENGEAWTRIRRAFSEAGYVIFHRVLDAADYGVPQHRERLFIVGLRSGEFRFPAPTHGPDAPRPCPFLSAGEAIKDAPWGEEEIPGPVGGRYGHLLREIPPGLNYSFFTEKMGHPRPLFAWRSKFSDFLYKADPERPIRTLKAQGGQCTGPFHWDNRPFTLGELKRLQSFPDDYLIVGGRQTVIHQIGNSVPPLLAEVLARAVLFQVFDEGQALPLLEEGQQLGFRRRKRALTDHYREKARQALSNSPSASKPTSESGGAYRAMLTPDFDLRESSTGPLRVAWGLKQERWSVDIHQEDGIIRFRIHIEVPELLRATLSGDRLDKTGFVSAWKAFERALAALNRKADLVQLSGYYQYPPQLRARLEVENTEVEPEWARLQKVVAGEGTREILSAEQLAELWECAPKEVMEQALRLRACGYEVRNHRTNPTIAEGCYLIPYAFPTLSPNSVQLRKSLEG